MAREDLGDLQAFMAVARERSFTAAAARLGVSRSALSHTLRALEARLGVRLLTRTTRSVSPTAAGDRLLQSVGSRIEEIEAELAALKDQRDKPAGTIRISATEHALNDILLPALSGFLPRYPDIHVEVVIDYGLTDIVARRIDAGVRWGEQVGRGMIAVRIGPDMRMAVVGAPGYFADRSEPKKPQELTEHNCLNLRLPAHDAIYAWEFGKGKRQLNVRVEGQFISNAAGALLNAAVKGMGLAYLPEGMARDHVVEGRLVRVLEDWCPPSAGYHLYYASRRQTSPAFALLVEALRYRK